MVPSQVQLELTSIFPTINIIFKSGSDFTIILNCLLSIINIIILISNQKLTFVYEKNNLLKNKNVWRYPFSKIRSHIYDGFENKSSIVRRSCIYCRFDIFNLGKFIITNETFVFDFQTNIWKKINFYNSLIPS